MILRSPEYNPTAPKQPPKKRGMFPCPALHTNTSFVANRSDEFDGDARIRRVAMAKAEKAGVSTVGKRFCGQLCRPGVPLDPQAWLSESDLKGETKNRCVRENWNCEELGVTAVEIDAPDDGPYQVAENIVQEEVRDTITDMHEKGEKVTPQQKADLTDKIRRVASGAE